MTVIDTARQAGHTRDKNSVKSAPSEAASGQSIPDPASIRRILVTAYGHIGDVLPAGPVLRALHETYPQARISMLALKYVRETMMACPYLDEFIILKETRHKRGSRLGQIEQLLQFARLAPRLYGRFDLVLNLHINTRALSIIGWLTGAKIRAGFPDATLPRLVTHPAQALPKTASYLDFNRLIVEAIGITTMPTGLELWTTPGDEQTVQSLLDEHQVAANELLIGLHPGTHWTCQQWSPKEWALLADQLVSRYGARLILSGAEDERELARAIIDLMTVKDARPIDATGRTNFLQFAALVKRLDLFICVNSSAPKVALAMKTPTLNLLGYESPVWNVPIHDEPMTIIRGCDDTNAVEYWCPYNIWGNTSGCHRAECIGIGGLSLITPAMVLRQVERRLNVRRGAPTSKSSAIRPKASQNLLPPDGV